MDNTRKFITEFTLLELLDLQVLVAMEVLKLNERVDRAQMEYGPGHVKTKLVQARHERHTALLGRMHEERERVLRLQAQMMAPNTTAQREKEAREAVLATEPPAARVCDYAEIDDNDCPMGPPCGKPATHLACVPVVDSPRCAEHRCRCNKTIAPEPPAADGDALEMLRGADFGAMRPSFKAQLIAAIEAERAGADIRVENAQGALRKALEDLATETLKNWKLRELQGEYRRQEVALSDEKRAHSETKRSAKANDDDWKERFDSVADQRDSLRSDLAARDATIAEMEEAATNSSLLCQVNASLAREEAESADLREKLSSTELLLSQADETVADLREKLRQAEERLKLHDGDQAEPQPESRGER